MNIYQVIIVAALLADGFLNFVADLLNLRRLSPELPPEFRDVHDRESYARSQEYLRANTRFAWLSSAVGLLALFVFWGAGGFAALHRWVEALEWPLAPTGVLYILVLLLGRTLLKLPFRIYDTFVIEERFGFNRTTPKTFVLDLLKGLVVGAAIGIPLLAAILFLFDWAGDWGWLYGWVATSVFLLVVQFVAPRWIMPWFNKFQPLPEEEEGLREKIDELAETANFPVRDVSMIDGSRRSSKANAFFAGFGRNRRIALFDTLIANHSHAEIVAVLAHEIGHFRKKHVPLRMFLGIVHAGVLFFILSIFLDHAGLYEAFHITDHQPIYAGLVFFSLLYHPVEMVLSMLLGAMSRRHEYAADRFADELTGRGEDLAAALKKLSRDSLANLTPHPFYVFLNYSHPPVLERIRRLTADKTGSHTE